MINKSHRFHGLGSLRPVYKYGHTARGQFISLKYLENKKRSTYRCAVVVSKKVSKSAVVRNRIRRRVMEIVRLEEPKIIIPYDMVLTIFSEEVAEMPAEDLTKTLKNLLTQAGVVS